MTAHPRKVAYNKLRFDWKKQINADGNLSRGAKQFACVLCDSYVNKHSGCCWPSNATLARALAVDKRTIQRRRKELQEAGWLLPVRIENKRRAFQIAFPGVIKGNTEHDKLSPSGMTKSSPDRDRAVTPYKNQGNNQERSYLGCSGFKTVLILECEASALNSWKDWVQENTDYDASEVFDLLRKRGGYLFPVRYPKDEDMETYLAFFKAAIQSNGFSKPGEIT